MGKTTKNVALILLFLTLIVLLALMIYLHFFASADQDISGQWTTRADLSEQASVTAFLWLQDIEGVDVSLEELETCMEGLTVQVDLTLEQTARSEGTFRCYIVPESYENCNQAAYEAFAGAFRELLGERLLMADYGDAVGQEEVEALVADAFGMSTEAYLMSYGPVLMPPLEDLQAQYDGSGTYETVDGILIRRFDAGGAEAVREEYYIRKDASLILSGEAGSAASAGRFFGPYPMIYTLQEEESGKKP